MKRVVCWFLLATASGYAQGTIQTFAGGAGTTPPSSIVLESSSFTVDGTGNVFLAGQNRIRKLTPGGVITNYATNIGIGDEPYLAIDGLGNLLFDKYSPFQVLKLGADGGISPIYSASPILSREYARHLAGDSHGNVYMVFVVTSPPTGETYSVVKVSPTGSMSAVVNLGSAIYPVRNMPTGLTVDSAGNAYVAKSVTLGSASAWMITRINPDLTTTVIVTYDGAAGGAIAADNAGNLFFVRGCQIHRVNPARSILTVAGTGECATSGDGGPVLNARINPTELRVDGTGAVYFTEGRDRLRKFTVDGPIKTIAGQGAQEGIGYGDGGPATSAILGIMADVSPDSLGNLWISDGTSIAARRVTATGIISSVPMPSGYTPLASDGQGNLYGVTHTQLFQVAPNFTVTPIPGSDANPLTSIAANSAGIIYGATVDEQRNGAVRRIMPDGTRSYVANCGGAATCVDSNPVDAGSAALFAPTGIAVNGDGEVFFAEPGRHRVRKLSGGTIRTIAGTGVAGFSGDGGQAAGAQLNGPGGVAVDNAGNLFISDTENHRVRKVSPAGVITTLAGTGIDGFSGDGGPATLAQMTKPGAIKVNAAGVVFFTDNAVRRVRTISAPAPVATTFATIPAGMPLRIGGTPYTSPAVLTLDSGSVINVEALPAGVGVGTRTKFTSWSDGGAAAHTITLGMSAATYTAVYATEHQLTTTALPTGAGIVTVLPASSDGYYSAGQQVQVTATAASGFAFTSFSGNASGSTNPLTVTMSGPRSFTAEFRCTYGLPATSVNLPGSSGAGNVTVTTGPGCAVGPVSDAAWLTVQPTSGIGTTTFTFRHGVNNGAARTGTISINGQTFTVLQAPAAIPTILAAAPQNAAGLAQTFTVTARDGDGESDLSRLYFLVNAGPTIPANGCHGFYDRDANAFYLFNDALTAPLGPVAPGSAATASNSQCAVVGSASERLSGGGTDVTLRIALRAQGSYADSPQNVYVLAQDRDSHDSGWIQASKWIPQASANQPPSIVSGKPANATGSPQTFLFTARDTNGSGNIYRLYFLVNEAPSIPAGACHGFYERASNAVFLFNDTLTTILGPLKPGESRTLQNGACTIHGATTRLAGSSGTDLDVEIGMSLDAAFGAKPRRVYLWARDNENNDTGWVQTGQWSHAGANVPPTLISAPPATATGSPETFTITARDANGFTDLERIYFLVNNTATVTAGACHGLYDRPNNAVYLFNDNVTAAMGPLTPGSGTTLANSACTVHGDRTQVTSATGTDLVFKLGLSLRATFATTGRNLYLWVKDTAGNGTGWVQTSVWNPSIGNLPPILQTMTPAEVTGSPQTFTITARDPNGFANLSRIYFLVNVEATISTGTCHGLYDRASNSVVLYNDALTGVLGPLTAGTSGTLENSACGIHGETTGAVSGAGTDLVVRLGISLKGAFGAGEKSLYIWLRDAEANDTGWIRASIWRGGATAPSLVSAKPAVAAGSPQTFRFVTRDPNGYQDLYRLYFLVSGTPEIPANTCHGFYERSTNGLYLYKDGLTAVVGPLTPGSAGTLQNSQCIIDGTSSQLEGAAGTDLTLRIGMGLRGEFAATAKNVYMWVRDNEANDTGWVAAARWNP